MSVCIFMCVHIKYASFNLPRLASNFTNSGNFRPLRQVLASHVPPAPLSQVIIWPLNAHHNAHIHAYREVTGNTFSHSKSPMTLVSPVFPPLSTLTSFKNPVCIIIIVFKAHNSFCYQFQNFANLCQYFHVPYSIHNLHHNLLWHILFAFTVA